MLHDQLSVFHTIFPCSVGWNGRIHWFHLCRGARPPSNECSGYNTKHSDGEVLVNLELWGMRSTPSLPSLPGPIWPGWVASDRVLSMGQIELNYAIMLNWIAWNRIILIFKLRTYAKFNCLKWNCFWHWNCTFIKLNCLN